VNAAIPAAIKKLEGELEDWKRRHAAAVADLETVRSLFRKELTVTRRLERNCDSYEAQLAFLEARIGPRWNELVAEYEKLMQKALHIADGGTA
jgi:predicted  nucleic acid-binding Zn-ribbon protein